MRFLRRKRRRTLLLLTTLLQKTKHKYGRLEVWKTGSETITHFSNEYFHTSILPYFHTCAQSCSRSECPSLSRLVFRYFSLCGLDGIWMGIVSTISNPYPERPIRFFGLLLINFNRLTPRYRRICA